MTTAYVKKNIDCLEQQRRSLQSAVDFGEPDTAILLMLSAVEQQINMMYKVAKECQNSAGENQQLGN